MFSNLAIRSLCAIAALTATAVLTSAPGALLAQTGRNTPKFYPDDPLLVDDDAAFDASGAKELELSEYYDFLQHTFGSPASGRPCGP